MAYSIKPTCLKTEEFHHKSNCQPVQEEFKSLYFSHNIVQLNNQATQHVYGKEKPSIENKQTLAH